MILKIWKQFKFLTPGKYLGSLGYGHTRDHYVTLKNYYDNDYIATWRNRHDVYLSKKDRIKTMSPIKTVWKINMQKENIHAKWKWLCYSGKLKANFLLFYKICNDISFII